MTSEALLRELNILKNGDRSILMESLKSALRNTFIMEFKEGDERPCENNDFLETKKLNEIEISHIKLILENLINSNYFSPGSSFLKECDSNNLSYTSADIENDLLALILIMCGENVTLKPWNTEITVKNCSDVLSLILELFSCKNASELISKSHKSNLIKNVLQLLRPNLLATSWKRFPASVLCFSWILETVTQPELSSHLPVILPTALLLIDDFVVENRLVGVKCFNHIIPNVTAAELQFHGYGDVIYSAFMPLLRVRKANVINAVIPCLLSLTIKLEMDFREKNVTQWSRFDSILELYLENMELEQSIELRTCYIENLMPLVDASGICIIRWSKRLLRIFREFMETAQKFNDEKTKKSCLLVIEKYIEASALVANFYAKNLVYTLLIALLDTRSNSSSNTKVENTELALKLIKKTLKLSTENDKNELKTEIEGKFRDSIDFRIPYQHISVLFEKK